MKTLGEFYREKILSQKELIFKEILYPGDEIKIDNTLYGYELITGKDHITCRSEEDARYLKVFIEAGMREIYIPADQEYLNTILPELETLKKKIDEIINDYLDTVMSRKIREKVRYEVYMELTK